MTLSGFRVVVGRETVGVEGTAGGLSWPKRLRRRAVERRACAQLLGGAPRVSAGKLLAARDCAATVSRARSAASWRLLAAVGRVFRPSR